MNILRGTLQLTYKCMILSYLIYITELRGRNPSCMWRTFPFTLVAIPKCPQLLELCYTHIANKCKFLLNVHVPFKADCVIFRE